MKRYALHGLVIASPIPLSGETVAREPDVTVTVGPIAAVPGAVVLAYEFVDGTQVRATRAAGEITVTFFDGLEARFSAALDAITLSEPTQVMLEGWVLAMLLELRGQCVLHASVVQRERCVAFVGNSGMGKTTLAFWAWQQGAALIAEDMAVVGEDGFCHAGSTVLRLRHKLCGGIESVSSDGRHLIPCGTAVGRTLDAIVIPWLFKEGEELVAPRRLTPAEATAELCRYPRVFEWRDPAVLGGRFQRVAQLCGHTPVYHVAIPWGPPWEPTKRMVSRILNGDLFE